MNWAGLWITFQAGFTESFIASSVVVSVALSRGRKNAVAGTILGLVAAGLLAFILQAFLLKIPVGVLHWVSSVLLLGFGLYLLREFVKATRAGDGLLEFRREEASHAWSASAITVAGWGVFNEGLEILVVWLAIALRDGTGTATLGVALGIGVILSLAVIGRRVFRLIPPRYLDLIAGIALIAYGVFFGSQAIR